MTLKHFETPGKVLGDRISQSSRKDPGEAEPYGVLERTQGKLEPYGVLGCL